MKTYFAGLLLLVLMGCATPVQQQEIKLATKPICCNSVRDFTFQSLNAGSSTTIKLDETAPAYDFGRGKTYFGAVKLDIVEQRILAIRSHFNGMLVDQYLQPIFIFLDNNYETLGEATPSLRFVNETFRVDAHMGGVLAVPQEAAYVIVSTAKFDGEPDPARTAPGINVIMIGNSPVVTSSSGRAIKLTRSPTGQVWLGLLNR